MRNTFLNNLKALFVTVITTLSYSVAQAATYTVSNTSANPTTENSWAWVLDQIRNTDGPHVINFELPAGTVIDHTIEDLNDWRSDWFIAVNLSGGTEAKRVIVNGNGCILSNANNPTNSGINTLTIAGTYITFNDLSFTGGSEKSPWGAPMKGAGVIFADARSLNPNEFGISPELAWGNVIFNRCNFHDNQGPGIVNSTYCSYWDISSGSSVSNCMSDGQGTGLENIVLNDCEAYGNDQSGIVLQSVNGFEINNSSFHDNKESGIQLQEFDRNGVIENVACYNNGLPSTGNSSGNVGAGILLYNYGRGNCTDITIYNSSIYDNNTHGIECVSSVERIAILNSEIYNNGVLGNGNQGTGIVFQFGGSLDNTVASCTIYDNADAGIYMYKLEKGDHRGNVFHENTLTNNGGGIILMAALESFIANNIIDQSEASMNGLLGHGNGVYLGNGSNNSVVYNNTISNTGAGLKDIYISDEGIGPNSSSPCKNTYLLGNNMTENAKGIYAENAELLHIGEAVNAPTISRNLQGGGSITINAYSDSGNIVHNSTDNGLELNGVTESMITGNTFIGGEEYGILAMDSKNNRWSQNNISCNQLKDVYYYSASNELPDYVPTAPFFQAIIQNNTLTITLSEENNGQFAELFVENTNCDETESLFVAADTVKNKEVSFTLSSIEHKYVLSLSDSSSSEYISITPEIITSLEAANNDAYHLSTKQGEFILTSTESNEVNVYTSSGLLIESHNGKKQLSLGRTWDAGLYIVRIIQNGEIYTEKLIKE